MTTSATIDKMKAMKLYGMAASFQSLTEHDAGSQLATDELLAQLIDAEWTDRQNRRVRRFCKAAKLRYQASFQEIDFNLNRTLDKREILRLADCIWVKKKQNIIITGPTGVGKSYLACALGYEACNHEYKTMYFNTAKLFTWLQQAKADNSYITKIDRIQKQEVLILDDFGIEPITNQNKMFLLEIIEDKYGRGSTIISTQFPVKEWHGIIQNATVSDAICDRLVHNAIRIDIKGDSARKIYGKRLS